MFQFNCFQVPITGSDKLYVPLSRCHSLRVYPVCVCNTVRLGLETGRWYNLSSPPLSLSHTTWNRRVHGLRVYPVWVCDKVRLGQDTTWNRREHRLSVSPNWVCTMLGGYKRWTFSDGFGDHHIVSAVCTTILTQEGCTLTERKEVCIAPIWYFADSWLII